MKKSQIDILIFNLLIYLHPDFFLPPYNLEIKKGKNFDVKLVTKYWQILTTIDWFVKKISRYEIFFMEFYPTNEKITQFEALEHHIHAYLEDMETVKNKLTFFVDNLKKDLIKISTNKKEINEGFALLRGNIFQVFSSSYLRVEHRHGKTRFADHYVVDGQVAQTILEMPDIKNRLTETGLEKVNNKLESSIIEGKKWWAKNAADNYQQIKGLVNEVMKRNSSFLYEVLEIKPISLKV